MINTTLFGISGKIGAGKDEIGKILQWKLTRPDMSRSSFELLDAYERSQTWQIKKFGGKVKEIASLLTGIPLEAFEDPAVKNSLLPEQWDTVIPIWDHEGKRERRNSKTVRWMLQTIGTDAIRKVIHPDAWVNALFSNYKLLPDASIRVNEWIGRTDFTQKEAFEHMYPSGHIYPNWIITDVRFPNELKAIKDRGGIVIRIDRDLPCEVCKLTRAERRGNLCFEITCPSGRSIHESETSLNDHTFDYTIDNSHDIRHLEQQVSIMLQELKRKLS